MSNPSPNGINLGGPVPDRSSPAALVERDPGEPRLLNSITGMRGTCTVRDFPNGELRCTCRDYMVQKPGQARWCIHVQDIYDTAWDSKPGDPLRTGPCIVVVNVNPEFQATVDVEPLNRKGYRRVTWNWRNVGNIDLGFIQLTEGRGAIREALIEQILWRHAARPDCESAQHEFLPLQESDTRRLGDHHPRNLLDTYMLYKTGVCNSCLEKEAVLQSP
jgi:hypothetical protein